MDNVDLNRFKKDGAIVPPEESERFTYTGQDQEDAPELLTNVEENPDSSCLTGMHFGIDYLDTKGQRSQRWVSVAGISHNIDNEPLLKGFCFLRRQMRSFKFDRIQAIFNEDGEFVDARIFLEHYGIQSPDTLGTGPGAQQRHIARNGIRFLCGLARVDGHVHPKEIEFIADYCEDRSFEEGVGTDEEDRKALIAYLQRQHPPHHIVMQSIKNLTMEEDHNKKLLFGYAQKVMDADGVQHESEFDLILDLKQMLAI